ncbi:MAG: ABC transporter permease, partial [Bacteroidota bacterium]
FRPSIIRPAEGFERLNHYGMFKNYFKVALRNLSKNKSYVFTNTLGMGIALACCMTAYLLLAFNIEFDYYFKDTDLSNTVKLIHHQERADGAVKKNMVAPIVMPPIAAEDISGIEDFTRYVAADAYVSYGEESFEENISFADESFFELFNFKLLSGALENFKDINSIFLSREMANKYFNNQQPVGKLMIIEMRNKEYEVVVGGVLEDIPLNTTFHNNFIMRIENYMDLYDIQVDSWGKSRDACVVFKLSDISQRESISKQLNKYVKIRNEVKTNAKTLRYELIPFTEKINRDEIIWSHFKLPLSFVSLVIFIFLGGIILLIACFNLTTTTIVLTVRRLKEIGVRKVVGAARWQIVNQFLLEITITVVISVVIGLLVAQLTVPEFAAMWGLPYGLSDLNGINLMIMLTLVLFFAAILSGAYPALFNSKFKPIVLLKGNLKIKGTNPFTRVLLTIQFSLSVAVLVAGIFFTRNATYQRQVSFGYETEKVFLLKIEGQREYELMKNTVRTNPKLEHLAVTNHHFGFGSYNSSFVIEGSEFTSHVYEVGADYFKVMGLEFTTGRDFKEGSQIDFETAAIIDQNFAE